MRLLYTIIPHLIGGQNPTGEKRGSVEEPFDYPAYVPIWA